MPPPSRSQGHLGVFFLSWTGIKVVCLVAAMNSKTNPGGPAGYFLGEITSGENGVATLWWSHDAKDHVRTMDGPIRDEIEKHARRHGIPFDKAARRSRRGRVRQDETPKGAIADSIAQIALPPPGLEKTNPTYPPQPIIQTKFWSRLEK